VLSDQGGTKEPVREKRVTKEGIDTTRTRDKGQAIKFGDVAWWKPRGSTWFVPLFVRYHHTLYDPTGSGVTPLTRE
jgi:hypothetical protein